MNRRRTSSYSHEASTYLKKIPSPLYARFRDPSGRKQHERSACALESKSENPREREMNHPGQETYLSRCAAAAAVSSYVCRGTHHVCASKRPRTVRLFFLEEQTSNVQRICRETAQNTVRGAALFLHTRRRWPGLPVRKNTYMRNEQAVGGTWK